MQVTSISWKENELNMVDTPGHADFGGEVSPHLVQYIVLGDFLFLCFMNSLVL